MAEANALANEGRLVVRRTFDAAPEVVFNAWIDPAQLANWFGPHGATIAPCAIDPRPGGSIRFCMRIENLAHWLRGEFREIEKPRRLVFALGFSDESGNPVAATYYGMSADFPLETVVTVTFIERGGRTEVTMEQTIGSAVPERDDTMRGWTQSFERLAAIVEAT